MSLEDTVAGFMEDVAAGRVDIYNEFSLQHEFGLYLRKQLSDKKVQFERNVSFFDLDKSRFLKREIDISVFSSPHRTPHLAIELKFPRNGQYPEQMFSFCKDISFLEQLRHAGFEECAFLAVADDRLFYEGTDSGIYSFFRGGARLTGKIQKPTGKRDTTVTIGGEYDVRWQPATDSLRYAYLAVGSEA